MIELSLESGPVKHGGSLADAIAILESAPQTGDESERARTQIVAFVESHADALERSCLEGHLTGSALVVDHTLTKVLVMLHTKLGLWLQPGGHADGEGYLGTVAVSEAAEETGIEHLSLTGPPVDFDVHAIPARPGEPEHLHLDVRYVVLAPPDAVVRGNHESRALRWVTLAELDDLAGDQSLRRLASVGLSAAQTL